MQIVQQAKLNSYFTEMNGNVNTMKQLMLFTKNFNTEFKNQIIGFGRNLKDVNNQMGNLEKRIKKTDDKANYFTKIIQEDAKIKDQKMIQMNSEMLKGYLQNTTKIMMDDYKNKIKNEIINIVNKMKNSSKLTNTIKVDIQQKRNKEEKKNQKNNKVNKETSEEKDSKIQKIKKIQKLKKIKKEKINTQEIIASTFSNEDAFDEVNPNLNLSSQKSENK